MAARHYREQWFGAWAHDERRRAHGQPLIVDLGIDVGSLLQLNVGGLPLRARLQLPRESIDIVMRGNVRAISGVLYYRATNERISWFGKRRLALFGIPPAFTVMDVVLHRHTPCQTQAWRHALLRLDVRRNATGGQAWTAPSLDVQL